MSDFTLGLVLLVVGMGGTLLSLGLLSLLVGVLKRLFPYKPPDAEGMK